MNTENVNMDVIVARGIICHDDILDMNQPDNHNGDIIIQDVEGSIFLLGDSGALLNIREGEKTNLTKFILDAISPDVKRISIRRINFNNEVDIVNPFKIKEIFSKPDTDILVCNSDTVEVLHKTDIDLTPNWNKTNLVGVINRAIKYGTYVYCEIYLYK